MRQRIDTLDIMKGIAMIFVIIDHSGYGLHPIIDHLEVPVFYLISGFLFTTGKSFRSFALKKVNSLLIPYVVFCLLYSIPYFIHMPDSGIMGHAINLLILPANYPLWFIKALFWALLIYYFIDKALSRYKIYVELTVNIVLATIVTTMCYTYAVPDKLMLTGLPQALQALPLIGFGHCGARIYTWFGAKDDKQRKTAFIAITLLSIVGATATAIEGVHLHICDLGHTAWLFYPCTLFCAVGFAGLCSLIVRVTPIKYIGENSISFFGFHAIALFIIAELIDMPQPLLPLAAIILSIPAVELWKRINTKY